MIKPNLHRGVVVSAMFCIAQSLIAAPHAKPHPARTAAQLLVEQFARAHPEVAAVELALGSLLSCHTVAATDSKDIGHPCDADELGPMRTGEPDVEAPSAKDPVYDITQALHDSAGNLIGAVGMDIRPSPQQSRADVLASAKRLLTELEAQIPSKQALLEPAH